MRCVPGASYAEVRCLIETGDLIAFSGKGGISGGIKLLTRSPVSHVGVAIRRAPVVASPEAAAFDVDFVDVLEATSLGGAVGVQVNRLSDHVARYAGALWWLPLRARPTGAGVGAALEWAFRELGRGYDLRGALAAGADVGLFDLVVGEDPGRWFCSELAAEFYRRACVLPDSIEPSEWVPIDLCRADVFSRAVQLAGDPQPLELERLDPLEIDRRARDRF